MAVSILGEAAVRLRPEAGGFAEQAEVAVSGPLREVAGKAAGLFAAAFAAKKIGEFLKDSVAVASDVGESTSKVGVVFGQASASVLKFAQTSATSMGLSKGQALEAAGTFGNLFRAIGLTEQKSADMSVKLTGLAGDLASFNNTDPAQALEALRAGLIGSTEPLRQYGVNLNQAQIGAEAVRLGLAKVPGTLTPAAQAQAAYALILQQTSLAQGDFGRTSGGLANQTRIISAQFTDLKGNVGGALVPFVQLGAHAISGVLLPALLKLSQPLLAFGDAAGNAFSDIQVYARAAFNGVDTSTMAVDNGFQRLGQRIGSFRLAAVSDVSTFRDAFKGGGLGVLATEPSLAGFLARFGSGLRGLGVQASSTWGSIVQTAGPVLTNLRASVEPALLPVKAALGNLFNPSSLAGSGTGFIGFFSRILGQVGPIVTGLITRIGPSLQTILPMLSSAFAAIIPVVSGVFSQILPVVRAVLPVILQITGIMSTLFRTAFLALLPVIPPLVQTIGQLITMLVGGLGPILTQLAPLISTLISTGLNEFKAVLAAIVPILPPLIGAIGTVAQLLAGAFLSVISALVPIMPVLVHALGQIAVAIGGALIAAVSAIAPLLPTLIHAFMSLVNAALLPLLPLLPAIASLIPPLVGVIVALVKAVAPFLPLIIQVVVILVQLAVTALVPLMPVIQIVISLVVVLVRALVPVVALVLRITGSFLSFAGAMVGGVVGAISTVLGWFQRLLSGIGGIVSSIGRVLGGMFDGLGSAASAAFGAVTGLIRGFINGYIGIVNGAIGLINRNVIGNINQIPGVSIPSIPTIPRLHSGGVFTSGLPSGEGLALLRDHELVVTPEQRGAADDLLRALLDGTLGSSSTTNISGGGGVTVNNHIVQQPGEPVGAVAARVTQSVVWQLNGGITRTVGGMATT